jgi:hypothetical protein
MPARPGRSPRSSSPADGPDVVAEPRDDSPTADPGSARRCPAHPIPSGAGAPHVPPQWPHVPPQWDADPASAWRQAFPDFPRSLSFPGSLNFLASLGFPRFLSFPRSPGLGAWARGLPPACRAGRPANTPPSDSVRAIWPNVSLCPARRVRARPPWPHAAGDRPISCGSPRDDPRRRARTRKPTAR